MGPELPLDLEPLALVAVGDEVWIDLDPVPMAELREKIREHGARRSCVDHAMTMP